MTRTHVRIGVKADRLRRVRVEANGVELCVDTRGAESDPAVLLIMGSNASMDWWEDEFCERLAAGGRFVVRYDHRVISLCLIATSPSGPGEDLPGMTDEGAERFAAIERPDWSDRRAVVEHIVELSHAIAGRSRQFDEQRHRALAGRVVDRTRSIESSMTNHELLDSPPRWRQRLAGLDVPTLVVHGREDSFLPYPHGQALAREIPGARLVTLDRAGHELPREDWDAVIPAILQHTGA